VASRSVRSMALALGHAPSTIRAFCDLIESEGIHSGSRV
jgi:hypothetical protein